VAYPGGSPFHLAIPRGPTAFCPHIHTRRRRDGGANEATEPSVAPSQAEDRFCNRRSPKVFTTKDQRRERRRTTRMDGRHACFSNRFLFSSIGYTGTGKAQGTSRDRDSDRRAGQGTY
jgi:hypothetical protein